MRDYGKVQTTFWTSLDTSAMTDTGRMLALYLLTSPHSNILGCFHLPIGYVSEDLKWGFERVEEGFNELFQKGFATRDVGSKWVVMHAYLRWNPIENPNQGIAAGRLFEQIPNQSAVKPLLAQALRLYSKHFPQTILDEFDTVPKPLHKPFPNQEQEQEQYQEQKQEQNTYAEASPSSAPQKREIAPAKPKEQPPTNNIWRAYSDAYESRYRAPPVRNAKVNGQLAQLLARLGAEESPAVAAFYVGHNNRYYVNKMHSVDFLLADCEKLRTEWATGNKVTAAAAIEADRLQDAGDMWNRLIDQHEAQGD